MRPSWVQFLTRQLIMSYIPLSKFFTLKSIFLNFCGQLDIITSSFYIVLCIAGESLEQHELEAFLLYDSKFNFTTFVRFEHSVFSFSALILQWQFQAETWADVKVVAAL